MNDTIRVRVVEFSDRKNYQLQWTDPDTGRKKTKSTDVERTGRKKERDDAVKAAGEWETKLNSGEVVNNHRLTWDQFRERYEREVGSRLAPETQKKNDTAFDLVESVMRPKRLADVTSTAVSAWLHSIQTKDRGPATAAIYGRALRAAMRWAAEMKLIREAPKFRLPKKQGDMAKGRALCGEEHDRIKAAVSKIVPAGDAPKWKRLLDGLWWSGLRLGEAIALSWEPAADVAVVLIGGERPVVRFRAAGQKGRRDELWPCPPEFGAMLEAVPEAERTGFVFELPKRGHWKGRATKDSAGRTISSFGEKAGVITGEKPEDNATAHAYRRAFGTRWSKRVMPPDLMRLMRHRDIETTMRYYVTADAASLADELWRKFGNGNAFGNTAPAETAKA
jgi:integrase